MSINISQRGTFPDELKATMTGSLVEIGSLLENPVLIIFDNLASTQVEISVNDSTGSTVWKTFDALESLILDLRCQQGRAPNFTFDKNTTFYGLGASGDFSISYIGALNN